MSKKISDFFNSAPRSVSKISENSTKPSIFIIKSGNVKKIKQEAQENLENQSNLEVQEQQIFQNRPTILENVKHEPEKECQIVVKRSEQITTLKSKEQKLDKNKTECKICRKKVKHIRAHKKIVHETLNNKFECDIDGKCYKTKSGLGSHIISLHLPKVKCDICHAEYSLHSLSTHKKITHATGPELKCGICSKGFKSSAHLKNHESIHSRRYSCNYCNEKCSTKHSLIKHKIEKHENPRNFECRFCPLKFNFKTHLVGHENLHDKNRPKPFKCQKCNYSTHVRNTYQQHLDAHDRKDKKIAALKNPIKCDKCPTLCRDKRGLKSHRFSVHPKQQFQCDECGNYFKLKFALKNHLALHLKYKGDMTWYRIR